MKETRASRIRSYLGGGLPRRTVRTAGFFASLILLGSLGEAKADFVYHFDNVYGGSAPGLTNGPWIDAVFQNAAPGNVRLTISNLNLSGSENVGDLYFNLNPLVNPNKLRFRVIGGSGGFDAPKFSSGKDAFNAGGEGKYDLRLSFTQTGTPGNRFGAGEYLVCDFFGFPSLTVADFAHLCTPLGANSAFFAAADLQRIGGCSMSGWLDAKTVSPMTVPEPSAGVLLLMAAGGGLTARRLRADKSGHNPRSAAVPGRSHARNRRRVGRRTFAP